MTARTVSLLTAAALVSACAVSTSRQRSVPAAEARESVYKAKVVLTVDITPLLPKDEPEMEADKPKRKGKGKGKKKSEEPSIIGFKGGGEADRAFKRFDNTIKIGWSGTAWVAARDNGRSFLVSAGHVCETGDVFAVQYIDWTKWTVETAHLPIVAKSHTLIARDNVEIAATVIADEDLDEKTYAGRDLCMLGAHGDLGTPLPIGDRDPAYGSHAEVIGAPTGLWGGHVAIIADLKYSGRGNVWGGSVAESLAFTGDVAGGNSGSAIMQGGRVVAMLNFGGTRFKELTTGVPWETLRDFVRRTLHRGPKG